MDVEKYLLFIPITMIYIAAPGPAVLLTIANGVVHGPRRTLFSIYGNATGHLVTASMSILGIQVVMMSSASLFAALKFLSFAFLLFKGGQFLFAKNSAIKEVQEMGDSKMPISINRTQLYRQGLLMSVLNPKPILFFTALFPQFVSLDFPLTQQLIVLTLTFMLISCGCLFIYTIIASQMKTLLSTPFWNDVFNKLAGASFIALGMMIAVYK